MSILNTQQLKYPDSAEFILYLNHNFNNFAYNKFVSNVTSMYKKSIWFARNEVRLSDKTISSQKLLLSFQGKLKKCINFDYKRLNLERFKGNWMMPNNIFRIVNGKIVFNF